MSVIKQYNSETNIWETIVVGKQGPAGFTGSAGDSGFTGSQGLPGDFAAVGFTGSAGVGLGIVNIFQQGTLIVFTGTARWYAPLNLEFQSITARVVESANDDIVIRVKKNDNFFAELIIPEDQFSVVITDNNNDILTMNEGDYLTVDILQVGTVGRPGSDLYIQFKYINT